jgi:group I intron endonuclease
MGFIYKITNKENNKCYIGQAKDPHKRWSRHFTDALHDVIDTKFTRAIKKYPDRKQWTYEILEEIEDQDELTQRESETIRFYNSIENGYNMTDAKEKSGGNTYMNRTEEQMDITREKLKQSKLGGKNPRAKAVICENLTTGEILHFSSQQECADHLQLASHMPISRRVRKTIKSPLSVGEYLYNFYYDE